MLKKRKAMELSINTIILAVIGLIILVVIIAIFVKKSGDAAKVFGECATQGGKCQNPDLLKCNGPEIPNLCPNEDDVCCVPVET